MDTKKKEAQLRKGVLEVCILSLLKDDEMYTSDLLKSLKEARLLVVEGTIYPLLSRLKSEGLVSYRWEESASGPPRKYFKLTEDGKLVQKALTTSWYELNASVNQLLKK
jgi:PadR family transcriptional regulator PadR